MQVHGPSRENTKLCDKISNVHKQCTCTKAPSSTRSASLRAAHLAYISMRVRAPYLAYVHMAYCIHVLSHEITTPDCMCVSKSRKHYPTMCDTISNINNQWPCTKSPSREHHTWCRPGNHAHCRLPTTLGPISAYRKQLPVVSNPFGPLFSFLNTCIYSCSAGILSSAPALSNEEPHQVIKVGYYYNLGQIPSFVYAAA